MDDETREDFGRVVRTLREAMGMNRAELRDATAACPQTDGKPISLEMIAKVEQGTRAARGATLRKLAHGLGVATEDLSERANAWTLLSQAGVHAAGLRAGALSGGSPSSALSRAALGAILPGALALGAAGAVMSSVHEREATLAAVRARLEGLEVENLADNDLLALADAIGARLPVAPDDGAAKPDQEPPPSAN